MSWRRMRKLAEDVSLSPEIATDARRVAHPVARPGTPDPEGERRRRFHRRVTSFIVGAVFAAGSIAALFGDGGFLELRRLRRERAEARELVAMQQERVSELRRTVESLKNDPAARERIAREELGYARKGEVTIILPRSSDGELGDAGAPPGPP